MRKYISGLIVCLLVLIASMLAGCKSKEYIDSETFEKLSNVTYPNVSEEKTYVNSQQTRLINDSYFKIVDNIYKEKENMIYSPASLYMALSLLSEGSTGASYNELVDYLGVNNLEELRKLNKDLYENNYYKNKNGEGKIANSIWVKNGSNINLDYVKRLEESYYAESFKADFSNENDKDNIIRWINNNTNDFLKLTKDNYTIDSSISLLLLNTIYFNNKWSEPFDKSLTRKDTFYSYKNDVEVYFMKHSVESVYASSDDYEMVYDYFHNGNKICYLLPSEGKNVKDYLNVNFMEQKWERVILNITVPKFKYITKFDLNNTLESVGVKSIFKGGLDNIELGLRVSKIKQVAGIELSEEGVKAAAVTSIDGPTSVEPIDKKVNIKLNRPFIYYILDSNNTILFSGVMNNPG